MVVVNGQQIGLPSLQPALSGTALALRAVTVTTVVGDLRLRAGRAQQLMSAERCALAFAEEIYQAPESWAKRAYVILYYKAHPKGGHFAAWEQPALLVSDVRATFKSLRTPA